MMNIDHNLLKKINQINKIKNEFTFKEIYFGIINEDGLV